MHVLLDDNFTLFRPERHLFSRPRRRVGRSGGERVLTNRTGLHYRMASRMKIRFAGQTDVGRKRPFNEDRFLCAEVPGPAGGDPWIVLAVADGIGGHAAGEVASSMAVDFLKDDLAKRRAEDGAAGVTAGILEESFLRINREIFLRAAQYAELNGMGTTLVAAVFDGSWSVAANVGDSRIYLVRDEALSQISHDHSWAAEQRRGRGLTAEDISRSPFRHMVTRSIGYTGTVLVDTFPLELRADDALLLCTDGLYGALAEKDVLKIISKHADPSAAAAALVKAANKAGGRDNITAVVARLDD
jgi:PPM family protein phosphatase